MADQRAIRILHRVLCMAVKLIEVEYGIGKQGGQCALCAPPQHVTEVVVLTQKSG